MKVIDLYNKIANDDDFKKIKFIFNDYTYTWNDDKQDYDSENTGHLKTGILGYLRFSKDQLNREIEIIEDKPKEDIPTSKLYKNNKLQYDLTPKEDKKIKRIQSNGESLYSEYIGEWLIHKERYTEYDELLMNKINEIIDKINGEDNE